jgi:hypothetical protein
LKKNRKGYDDDDGRTIAGMNVDGMPWYSGSTGKGDEQNGHNTHEVLRGPYRRAFTWGVLKAALLVMAVFVVGYFLFILFCTKIWFA